MLFLKMLANRRTNLSHGTRLATIQRYTRAYETDDQHETWYERNRNRQLKSVVFYPYQAAFNKTITWKSITVHSKLLLDQ